MDARNHDFQAKNVFDLLPVEIICYLFSFLEFKDLPIAALVSACFSECAQLVLSEANQSWEAGMQKDYALYHAFLVETKKNKQICWWVEYSNVHSEFYRKAQIGYFQMSDDPLFSFNISALECLMNDQTVDALHFHDPEFLLRVIWLGKTDQIPNAILNPHSFHGTLIRGSNKESVLAAKGTLTDLTLLETALMYGHAELVKYFYENSCRSNTTLVRTDTCALEFASKYGHLAVCLYLWDLEILDLNQNAEKRKTNLNLNKITGKSFKTLFQYGHTQLIQYCIDHDVELKMNYYDQSNILSGSENNLELEVNLSVYQTLVWSIQYEDLDVLKKLLKKYSDQPFINYALYEAAKQNKLQLVKYLLNKASASLKFVMPRDFLESSMPTHVTPFQIAGLGYKKTVEQYLFYKLTLPDLTLDLEQIKIESNSQVLLQAMRYVLQTFDQHWTHYLNQKLDIKAEKRDAQGNVSIQTKEIFYHKKELFSNWLRFLWKALATRLCEIPIDRRLEKKMNVSESSAWPPFLFRNRPCVASFHVYPMIFGREKFFSVQIKELPEELIELIDLHEKFCEKSGIKTADDRQRLFRLAQHDEYSSSYSESDDSDNEGSDAEDSAERYLMPPRHYRP